MKKLFGFVTVLALAFGGVSAHAADASCDAQATEKKLAGAAKTSFLKKCNADHPAAGNPACEAQAAEKKLHGAAKTSFVKKCAADGGPAAAAAPAMDAAATCAAKSGEKKLHGAAKTAFEKKCVADAAK
ncbi:hypothetical protein WG899_09775 [Paucibacter sp. AS339]|uniref:hypothetical protein n=1 Tax=Paucibacter hankyongi TaxID=3133434 RepID=UPI0030A7D084